MNENVWTQANSVSFSNSLRSDNQVKIYSLWDNSNLYFAYDVKDANLEAANLKLWEDDGGEIYLDTLNDKSASTDLDDRHFMTNINNLVNLAGSATVKTARNSTGYTMEIAIPWTV
ncbi:MAG: XynA [Candidatus Giovannonibacteria bacterium GW2011_GWA1_44_29]|uniref:XynA n=1 Tax=Candidatus Giovannonibacteria bacterium GW2011_GWA1_44_29 TaxID=1618646 RepID=A0A0G1IRT0_9BACT|nr:MAG: XynA [Candidatus Giovannonibacteria bacterium GW2011_GWA1_44_29]